MQEGTVLGGKYRIVRQIGSGGMGRVFEAIHEQTERAVAVKVLSAEAAQQPDTLVRFDREARAAGRIGHDNICEVVDVGFAEGNVPFLVMPLLRGLPLSGAIRQVGQLPLKRCIDITAQILAALAAAHAAGVVHRDLKPDNVFLVRMGDRDDFVKVLDFGISKMIGEHRPDATLTQTGTILGTPFYMSPEQARGLKDLDVRIDVYAMGAILYQMLTGKPPFDGESYNQLLSAILLDDFPKPNVLRPDVPPAVEEVVLRATEKDRERRYRDAGEMRQALLAAVTGTSLRPFDMQATTISSETLPSTPTGGSAPGTPLPSSGSAPTPAPVAPSGSAAPRSGDRTRTPTTPLPAPAAAPADSSGMPAALSASRGGPPVVLTQTGAGVAPSRVLVYTLAAIAIIAAAALAILLVGRAEREAGEKSAAGNAEKTSATDLVAAASPAPGPDGGGPAGAVPSLPPPVVDAGTTMADAEALQSAADGSNDAPADSAVAMVKIALAGLPPGAVIRADGEPRTGPVLDVPRGERTVKIEVAARGFFPWSKDVSAAADATIPVVMRPMGERPARDAGTADEGGAAPEGGTGLPGFGEGP